MEKMVQYACDRLREIYGCHADAAVLAMMRLDTEDIRSAFAKDCFGKKYIALAERYGIPKKSSSIALDDILVLSLGADCDGVNHKRLGLLYEGLSFAVNEKKSSDLSQLLHRMAEVSWQIAEGGSYDGRFDRVVARSRLTPKSHTEAVRAIMENALFVLAQLDPAAADRTCSEEEVMQASLKVDQISEHSKDIIRDALESYPAIRSNLKRVSEELSQQDRLDSIVGDIQDAKSVDGVQTVLDNASRAVGTQPAWVHEGLDAASHMVMLGRGTIYAEDHWFYKLAGKIKKARKPALRVCKEDSKFAAGGAASAGFLGGEAITTAAVGYAIGGSARQVMEEIWPGRP